MKKISLLIIMTALAVGAWGQEAEYTLIQHTYTHNADGSFDARHRKELKLLRNRIFTAYTTNDGVGESFILYNPAFMQLTINEAYTLLPDGKKIQTPENAFIEQLPEACRNCGRFNGIREMVVVHTALENGATIVLDYTLHIKSRHGYFSELVNLNERFPIKRLEIKDLDGKDTTLTDVAAMGKEPFSDLQRQQHYTIACGELPQRTLDKGLKEAASLLKQLKQTDALAYAEAIRNWVADNITTNAPIDDFLTDGETASASEVYASGCGTPVEKNILLGAMLNEAGFKADWRKDGNRPWTALTVTVAGLDYTISAHDKIATRLKGAALEEGRRDCAIEESMNWTPETLSEGYVRQALPQAYQQACARLMRYIPFASRSSALHIHPCNETYHYTLELPKGARLLGGDIDRQQKIEGVGEVKFSIKQNKRKVEILIDIHLQETSLEPSRYDEFRKMLSILTTTDKLLFKL